MNQTTDRSVSPFFSFDYFLNDWFWLADTFDWLIFLIGRHLWLVDIPDWRTLLIGRRSLLANYFHWVNFHQSHNPNVNIFVLIRDWLKYSNERNAERRGQNQKNNAKKANSINPTKNQGTNQHYADPDAISATWDTKAIIKWLSHGTLPIYTNYTREISGHFQWKCECGIYRKWEKNTSRRARGKDLNTDIQVIISTSH